MKMNRTFAALKLVAGIALLGMGTAADARVLAGGSIYGGTSQTQGTCYLYNAGTSTVTISSRQIIRESGINLNPTGCTTLLSNRTCAITMPIVNNRAHACRFVFTPDSADVRGAFEVRDNNLDILNSIELK